MRLATFVWMAIAALCIMAAIQERPNVHLIQRYRNGIGTSAKDNLSKAVPDNLVEDDPEAGEIVRYRLAYDLDDPKLDQLRSLIARYPDNEFFLSRLAEGLIEDEDGVGLAVVLKVVDRLIALSPDNAHYRYLRGWAILEAREGPAYLDEAIAEFELGHQTPGFYLPSRKYKERIDPLYCTLAFDHYDRGYIYPFYWDLETLIAPNYRQGKRLPEESLRHITDATVIMASRLIDHAYDFDSLSDGRVLLEGTEKTRLIELALTANEARQARYRLAQAVALDELEMDWYPGDADDHLIATSLMPFSVLLYTAVAGLGLVIHRRRSIKMKSLRRSTPMGAGLMGLLPLLLFLTILSLQGRWLSSESVISSLFAGGILFWSGYLVTLAFVGSREFKGFARRRLWLTVAYGSLWLNGVLLLLAGAGGFPDWSDRAEWASLIPFLRFWTALCALLLWVVILDHRPLLGRIPCSLALLTVMGFATFIMTFEIFAAQWRQVDRIYADPLARCGSLPEATQQTYARFIRDSGPPRYIHDDKRANALPEFLYYFAPEDMEAFLAKWHAEGKPIGQWERWGLLHESARDVRPIVHRILAKWDAADQSRQKR